MATMLQIPRTAFAHPVTAEPQTAQTTETLFGSLLMSTVGMLADALHTRHGDVLVGGTGAARGGTVKGKRLGEGVQ